MDFPFSLTQSNLGWHQSIKSEAFHFTTVISELGCNSNDVGGVPEQWRSKGKTGDLLGLSFTWLVIHMLRNFIWDHIVGRESRTEWYWSCHHFSTCKLGAVISLLYTLMFTWPGNVRANCSFQIELWRTCFPYHKFPVPSHLAPVQSLMQKLPFSLTLFFHIISRNFQ